MVGRAVHNKCYESIRLIILGGLLIYYRLTNAISVMIIVQNKNSSSQTKTVNYSKFTVFVYSEINFLKPLNADGRAISSRICSGLARIHCGASSLTSRR